MAVCRGGALPGTELMVKKAELQGVYPQKLTIGIAHALLGDQQDDRAHRQDKAEDVEDGGAHAAGGRQGRAGFVFDLSGNSKLRGIRAAASYRNFSRGSQLIVAGGSLDFFQVVGAVGKSAEGGRAIIVGCHDSGNILVCNPFDLLISTR